MVAQTRILLREGKLLKYKQGFFQRMRRERKMVNCTLDELNGEKAFV